MALRHCPAGLLDPHNKFPPHAVEYAMCLAAQLLSFSKSSPPPLTVFVHVKPHISSTPRSSWRNARPLLCSTHFSTPHLRARQLASRQTQSPKLTGEKLCKLPLKNPVGDMVPTMHRQARFIQFELRRCDANEPATTACTPWSNPPEPPTTSRISFYKIAACLQAFRGSPTVSQ